MEEISRPFKIVGNILIDLSQAYECLPYDLLKAKAKLAARSMDLVSTAFALPDVQLAKQQTSKGKACFHQKFFT